MPEGELAYGDENEVAKKIREALGVGDYETVRVITPQFDRTDGKKITWFPTCAEDLDKLKSAPPDILRDLGMNCWATAEDPEHSSWELAHIRKRGFVGALWLFPHEWYQHIPAGYPIVNIFFSQEKFEPGETDDDKRFGCLPYGIMGPKP